MKIHPGLLLPLALLLIQCDRGPGPAKGDRGDGVPLVPPPPPNSFVVDVQLSPAAKARLDSLGEKVEIKAMYYGLPNAAGKPKADEVGQIDLGSRAIDIDPGQRNTLIAGDALVSDRLNLVEGGPQVLINVYTARKVAEDNLLDCGIFEDTIAKAQEKPIAITCKLISPDPKQGNAQ